MGLQQPLVRRGLIRTTRNCNLVVREKHNQLFFLNILTLITVARSVHPEYVSFQVQSVMHYVNYRYLNSNRCSQQQSLGKTGVLKVK